MHVENWVLMVCNFELWKRERGCSPVGGMIMELMGRGATKLGLGQKRGPHDERDEGSAMVIFVLPTTTQISNFGGKRRRKRGSLA